MLSIQGAPRARRCLEKTDAWLDLYSIFPVDGRFESEFPGGRFLKQLSRLVQCTLSLASQVFVLLHAISRKRSPEREVLLCFCIARGLVRWLAPSNGIGSTGLSNCDSIPSFVHIFEIAYIYWPHNRHFQRMKALFGLAFSTQYRADLVLDGIASSIETGRCDPPLDFGVTQFRPQNTINLRSDWGMSSPWTLPPGAPSFCEIGTGIFCWILLWISQW